MAASNATVPAEYCRGLIHKNRHDEAECADTVGDLADLFFRMRTRIARVGLDSLKGNKLNRIHEHLHYSPDEGANSPAAKGDSF